MGKLNVSVTILKTALVNPELNKTTAKTRQTSRQNNVLLDSRGIYEYGCQTFK